MAVAFSLAEGVTAFLQTQIPKVERFPAAKLCIHRALNFVPKLEACLAAREAAAAAMSAVGSVLDFGDKSI